MNLQVIFYMMSAVFSAIIVGVLRKIFIGHLMDVPNERSSHNVPTPRGGGLGFIIGFAISLIICLFFAPNLASGIRAWLWVALIPLASIGVIDDWRSIPSSIRYLVHLSVALVVIVVCGVFPFPGLLGIGFIGSTLALFFTVICFTAMINFYNFMDGIDGLVAGVSAVQLTFLVYWCDKPVLLLWVAALSGFLFWNWSPAKIFMGDVGSTVLGAVVATAILSQTSSFEHKWISVTILFPLISDTIYTLCRRLIQHENIFKAHRKHIYQRLNQVGFSHSAVSGIYIILTICTALSIYFLGKLGVLMTFAAIPSLIFFAERQISSRKALTS